VWHIGAKLTVKLGGYARQQILFGKFDESDGLLTGDGREGSQEIVQGRVALDMVNEGLNGNTGSCETGFAAHAIRIEPDDFIKLGFLFHCHEFKLIEIAVTRKENAGQVCREGYSLRLAPGASILT